MTSLRTLLLFGLLSTVASSFVTADTGVPSVIQIGKTYDIVSLIGMGKKNTITVKDIDHNGGWILVDVANPGMLTANSWINLAHLISVKEKARSSSKHKK